MYAYKLTHLTGRHKNTDRTIVVATVEVNRFTFLVVAVSAAVSMLPALLVGLILGPYGAYAMAIPALFIFAGLFLVDQRTRKGLRLRRYEAMWDHRKTKTANQTIFVCGQPLKEPTLSTLIHTSVPLPVRSTSDGAVISASVPRSPGAKVGVFA